MYFLFPRWLWHKKGLWHLWPVFGVWIITYQREIVTRAAFCIFIVSKLFTLPQEKSRKKNLGLSHAFLLQLLHWHHIITAFQGRPDGRILFCWLITNMLIILKQFPPNQILTIQVIYPLVGLERFAPESRSNEWWRAIGLGVARRSFDRPSWEPVVGMENPHCDIDGLQVTLTGPKESQHHHGTHADRLQRPSRC